MTTAILSIGSLIFGFYLIVWEGQYRFGMELVLLGLILMRAHNAEVYAEQAKDNTEKILMKLEGENSIGDRTDQLTRLVETLQHSIRVKSS